MNLPVTRQGIETLILCSWVPLLVWRISIGESQASNFGLFIYGSSAVVRSTIIAVKSGLEELLQTVGHAMPTPGMRQ